MWYSGDKKDNKYTLSLSENTDVPPMKLKKKKNVSPHLTISVQYNQPSSECLYVDATLLQKVPSTDSKMFCFTLTYCITSLNDVHRLLLLEHSMCIWENNLQTIK